MKSFIVGICCMVCLLVGVVAYMWGYQTCENRYVGLLHEAGIESIGHVRVVHTTINWSNGVTNVVKSVNMEVR